jgi:hypothetical protein
LDELHETFEQAVHQSEVKTRQHIEAILAEHHAAVQAKHDEITALQQRVATLTRDCEVTRVKADAVTNCPTIPEETIAAPVPTSATAVEAPQSAMKLPATPSVPAAHRASLEFLSPSHVRSTVKFRPSATPGSIAKRYLEGTPGARPVQWVVEQANTEVKKLRVRAEQIARGEAGPAARASLDGYSAWAEVGSHGPESDGAGAVAQWRMKLHSMKLRFSEALMVIQEQDRLIHSGMTAPEAVPDKIAWCLTCACCLYFSAARAARRHERRLHYRTITGRTRQSSSAQGCGEVQQR